MEEEDKKAETNLEIWKKHQEKEGKGFKGQELKVNVSQAEVDRLVKVYKKMSKYRKSPLFAVQNMDNNERLVKQMVEELKKGEGGTGITE